jgi:hypothetical protein
MNESVLLLINYSRFFLFVVAGWLMVSNEIAQGVLGLAISFWGGKGNRPSWIATCATFQALTCFLLLLPHLTHGTSPADGHVPNTGGIFTSEHNFGIHSKGSVIPT